LTNASKLPHIVAVAGDPGGGRALAPVLHLLKAERKCTLSAFAYRESLSIWRNEEIACVPLVASDNPEQWLEQQPISLLVTATSCNGEDWEKTFQQAVLRLGVPSLALLDFWSNYPCRFMDDSGNMQVPDRIAVMDDNAAEQMASMGIDRSRLVVTGQPAFDVLPAVRAAFSDGRREELRRRLAGDGRLVVFVSQPLSSLYRDITGNPCHLGYDEDAVLEQLCDSLAGLSDGGPINLCILLHPREPAHRFSDKARSDLKGVTIKVLKDVSPHEAVMSADLVVGMTSMLLVEACLLGCPVVSLQPGLKGDDPLPTNHSGASVPVYASSEVPVVLRKMLDNTAFRLAQARRQAEWRPLPGATRRVADLAYRMCEGKRA